MQVQEILKSKTEVFLDQLAEAATKPDAEALLAAIKDFQTKAGITVDGKVGPVTKKAFQDAMKNTGETPPDTTDDASGAGDGAAAQNTAAEPAAPAQQPAAPAQQPAAPAQQPAAPAQQPAAQAARQQPAAPAQRQQPAAAAPAQQPAARPAATGGSGPGGAYTAGDVNNGNMPSGLPRETITNIQAAAAAARDPGAIVYDPNDDADF